MKHDLVEEIKPRLRGWLHTGIVPIALVAGVVLVAAAPEGRARWSAVIFALTSLLLFTTSAVYHRGRWSKRSLAVLKRLDHLNIYLIIAGSYTPFALLALDPPASTILLAVVWSGAIAGVLFRLFWLDAPRWLYTGLYISIGWAAIFVSPLLVGGAGVVASALVLIGGVLYTLGAVVYGLQRPDPWPAWFGFHEVFHAFTVAAWAVHYVAVSFVVFD
ncbi:MAG: hemolysin III family protein [Actinobacteria bacterium]|nr:hemolysin III family protein [Actinomycetota bacterium]